MSLLSDAQITAIRKLGVLGMTEDVTVYHHTPTALDPDNPYGDDVMGFRYDTTIIKGWVIQSTTPPSLVSEQGQVAHTQDYYLRVPVGSNIEPQDDVVIRGLRYRVVETNEESTWPAWLICILARRDT